VLAEPKSGPKSPIKTGLGGAKSPPPKTPKTPKQLPADAPEVFDFALDAGDEKIDIGREVLPDSGPAIGTTGKKGSGGSDSDVKLVPNAGPDSDVKLIAEGGPRTPKGAGKAGPTSPTPKKGPRSPGGTPLDSGVRLVPMDSDSDVKIVGADAGSGEEVSLGQQPPPSAHDSDIRLEKAAPGPKSDDDMNLTEEINLDEEIKKQETAQQQRPKSRVKPKSELKFAAPSAPAPSDSDADKEAAAKHPSSGDFELTPQAVSPDTSDFDLVPSREGSIVIDPISSDDFSLELPDDSAVLGGSGEAALTGPSSGINLSNPVDAGLSLEEGSDSERLDLDMSLDEAGTPKPGKRKGEVDSDSEFELSLDDDKDDGASSSEFELTLDDSGDLAPLESSPQAKAGGAPGEKDIFETDFEVPALDDSGSEVAALETSDTDLESSDFDLALDDSDLAVEDESGSQVVALDDESADEAAETLAGELGEDLDVEAGVEEDEEEAVGVGGPVREVVRDRIIEPAPWGALPTVFMLPCVIVMIVVGIMGFELVQSTTGFRSAGFLTKALGDLVGQKVR
jgi:hypothetical protein